MLPFHRRPRGPAHLPRRRRAWRLNHRHGRVGLTVAVLALGLPFVLEFLPGGLQAALPNGWSVFGIDLSGPVTYVRDGDTIVVGGTPVRIANLDCAERGTVAGDQATRRRRELAEGERVACSLEGRMSYDREVGTCQIESTGRDLGRALIGEGICERWW